MRDPQWVVVGRRKTEINTVDGQHIATVWDDQGDGEKNARLIAAAPEMYELLELLEQLERPGGVAVLGPGGALLLALEARKLINRIDGDAP